MIPEERAAAEKMEAEKKAEALRENIESMNANQINSRLKEIENRFREIDEAASSLERAEKTFGTNAYDKMGQEYDALEKERALLLVQEPEVIIEEKIDEIDKAIKKEEPDAKPETALVNISKVKETSMIDIIYKDIERAPAQILKDIKAGWAALQKMREKKEKPIWWPEDKHLEIVEILEDGPVADPKMTIEIIDDKAVVETEPVIDLVRKIESGKLESQRKQIEATEAGWDEIAKEFNPKNVNEKNKEIRKTDEYKTYLKAFENLGHQFKDMPIKPRGGDLLMNFLDEVPDIGPENSNLKKAGELIYKDILVGDVKMNIQDWEWKDGAKTRAMHLEYLPLLSDLTKTQTKTEKEIKEKKKYLKKLEPQIAFKTSTTEVWAHLAAVHNLKVELKIHEEYLNQINQALEDEKKGKRKVKEMPEAKELFQVPQELLEFPEVATGEEAA